MKETRILVSSIPMLRMMDEFEPEFAAAGMTVVRSTAAQTMAEDELAKIIHDFDGWIVGDDPATAAVLGAGRAGRLRVAIKWGVGIDNIDFDAARSLGLKVAHTPGAFGREVADLAIHYVVALARETYAIDRGVREGGWPKPGGISLAGRKAALVGFGDIGRQIAKRLLASEVDVLVYDPAYRPQPDLAVEHARWPDRIGEADFVIFACPLNSTTKGMFNSELLPRLRPGIRVINLGRGSVVAEKALIEGLERAIIHSAALDVFEVEPLPPNSALRRFPQLIFGSHNASNTVDAVRRASRRAMELLFDGLTQTSQY
jgi:D-3-phosphoglycerate dehydrogenase / 2-oxoglutarate reductase